MYIVACFVAFNYNWQFVASHTFGRHCPFSENSRTHRYIPSISVRCPFLIAESRSFLLSPRRHCHPIASAFTPIATKGFEYRRFWWERRAKKSDCRATTRERTNTSSIFPRGVVVSRSACTAKTPFAVFYYFSSSPTTVVASLTRSHFSKKYHEYFNSRWYCWPIEERPEWFFILYHAYPTAMSSTLISDVSRNPPEQHTFNCMGVYVRLMLV